jgi:hypothetical protein
MRRVWARFNAAEGKRQWKREVIGLASCNRWPVAHQAEPNHQDKVILTCSSTISHYFFSLSSYCYSGGRPTDRLSKFEVQTVVIISARWSNWWGQCGECLLPFLFLFDYHVRL